MRSFPVRAVSWLVASMLIVTNWAATFRRSCLSGELYSRLKTSTATPQSVTGKGRGKTHTLRRFCAATPDPKSDTFWAQRKQPPIVERVSRHYPLLIPFPPKLPTRRELDSTCAH
jgi:hypothetical protein